MFQQSEEVTLHKEDSYLNAFTRTLFFAHSTARLDAMCFTATISQYLLRIKPVECDTPAFDALYGVCSFVGQGQKSPGLVRVTGLPEGC
jgi:hypothetical protein